MSFLRLLTCLLALALPAAAAHAADPAPLSPAQTDAVNKLIHDYLMNNPKVLLEALERADTASKAEEAASASAAIANHREALEHDPSSPVRGNPQGDVTLVEFFDYRCPYCKAAAPTVQGLLGQDKKVRLVLKELPILGKASVFAARVALVAQQHGKYEAFHDAMFALKTPVTDEVTLDVAKSVGLDPETVKREMESAEIDKVLRANLALAQAIGVNGTPAFVVGDTLVPGAISAAELQKLIAAARKG